MLLSIYILFAIIGFIFFIIAVFFNEEISNIYLWPVVVIIFGTLFFASYNLSTGTTITTAQNVTLVNDTFSRTVFEYDRDTTYFDEQPFAWMFLALAALSSVLFIWDIWSKYSESGK